MDRVDNIIKIGQQLQIRDMYSDAVEQFNKELRPIIKEAAKHGIKIREVSMESTPLIDTL